MRDLGRMKYRLEVKLDSSQVFFLCAGLVTFSLLVFVLGVIVGRSRRPAEATLASAGPPVALLPDAVGAPVVAAVSSAPDPRPAGSPEPTVEPPEIPLGFYDNLEDGVVPTAKPAPAAVPTTKPSAPPDSNAPPGSKPAEGGVDPPRDAYTLQIIAYSDLAQAEGSVAKLKARGFDAYVVTAHIAGKGTVHRVRIGRYGSRSAAEFAAESLAGVEPQLKPIVLSLEGP